jgi:hypothetical protein
MSITRPDPVGESAGGPVPGDYALHADKRVMLRLWRDYLAGRWDYWPVEAAVSYALPGKEGNLSRSDGRKFYGKCDPWPGGAA